MPYLLIRHKVNEFGKWKQVFDEHEATRRASGCKSTRLFRNFDNAHETFLLLEWDDLEKASLFAGSEDLRKAMERAGVADRPDVYYLDEIELLAERER